MCTRTWKGPILRRRNADRLVRSNRFPAAGILFSRFRFRTFDRLRDKETREEGWNYFFFVARNVYPVVGISNVAKKGRGKGGALVDNSLSFFARCAQCRDALNAPETDNAGPTGSAITYFPTGKREIGRCSRDCCERDGITIVSRTMDFPPIDKLRFRFLALILRDFFKVETRSKSPRETDRT